MPLIKSASDKARSANIAAEIRSGKKRDQAVAIAYSVQREAKKRKYASGGSIPFHARAAARGLERSGMIRSPVAGRTDSIGMKARAGSYVIPADTVSSIGQGNSLSGANALSRLFKMGPYGAGAGSAPKATPPVRMAPMARPRFAQGGSTDEVDIVTAGGEFVVPPEIVTELGHGDIEYGHEVLDHLVKDIRRKTVATLKKLPGPK